MGVEAERRSLDVRVCANPESIRVEAHGQSETFPSAFGIHLDRRFM
jgi:hypothetical protein